MLGAAVALVALAVGAIGPARGAARDKDKQTTFTVEALTTEQNFEGTALGDQIVLTTQLLKGDTEVGHQGGVCTVTSVERNEAQCVATYSFRGGQITAQALIILGDPAPYAAAITGGSGKYQGVEGEVRVDPASETQPRGILTFHLQDRSARNRQSWEGQGVSPALPAATRQPSAPPLRWAHNY